MEKYATGKILLFIGSDITAHLVMNRVVEDMVKRGFEPVLLFPKHVPSKKATLPELQEYAYYERTLLNEVVYPFLEENSHPDAYNLTPHQLAEKYNLGMMPVENVNDPDFINSILVDDEIKGAFSIRCFQIFKPEIINVMNEKGFFMNLHPGNLPEYRGVMSTARAMADNKEGTGWTLHHIDAGIDTGRIIDMKAKRIDYNLCSLANTIRLAPLGAEIIKAALDQLHDDNVLTGYPQAQELARYFSYPDAKEIKRWKKNGIVSVNVEHLTEKLVDNFSKAGSEHALDLARLVDIHQYESPGQSVRATTTIHPPSAQTSLSKTMGCLKFA